MIREPTYLPSMTKNSNEEQSQKEIERLHAYIEYLQAKLRDNYIRFEPMRTPVTGTQTATGMSEITQPIIHEEITPEHVQLFYSLFRGRRDVYSKRGTRPNPKTGKTGYYTQCWNFWKAGVCPKQAGEKIACSTCANQQYKELMGGAVMAHLKGEREDAGDVIGIYPILSDESCNFLAFDFDHHDAELEQDSTSWIDEVQSLRKICEHLNVPTLVERSRSGNGAHVWLFFQEAIPAKMARQFGTALLTKGAESVNLSNFRSYDRMIPAQDHLPAGGLGNLIALPLQGQALKQSNSAFVDEHWLAYPDQWQELRLAKIKKITTLFITKKIEEWTKDGLFGQLSNIQHEIQDLNDPDSKPWEKRKHRFHQEDVEGAVDITLANRIYIHQGNLKPRLQNQLRRLAAFSNPKFYKNQAMGFSTHGISRIIACCRDIAPYISLPRACKEQVIELLNEADISYQLKDERQAGRSINIRFKGTLYPEQQLAADEMLKHETGILSAATAFGKTALGAYLVAAHHVNTLILVHNTEILKNWLEDLDKFLDIDEKPPNYQTKSGRIKTRKSPIGSLRAAHCSLTGIIDVAMISSLGKSPNINPIVKDYGLVIMDECHHAAAATAEDVLNEISATHVYGLTATPKRDDGHELKMLMQLGIIRHRFTARDKARQQGIGHYIYPRFTRLIHPDSAKMSINEIYQLVRSSDVRNAQIVADVTECIAKGRCPLVLSKFKDHAAHLYEQLQGLSQHIFLLQGGRSSKERDFIRQQMHAVPEDESIILIAIGQYIGEGFNYPRLDTLMLTTPIAWQGNVEQYAGRLHRDFEGKNEVIIYDYIDAHIPVLERMYHKRLRAYRKIAYEIYSDTPQDGPTHNIIYNSENYLAPYEWDLAQAQQNIVIFSNFVSPLKARQLLDISRMAQARGVSITIITQKSSILPPNLIASASQAQTFLTAAGISIIEQERIHLNTVIIDSKIVWYSSCPLLAKTKNSDMLIRLPNTALAQELLEINLKH